MTTFPGSVESDSNNGIRISTTTTQSIATATLTPVTFASGAVDFNDGGFTVNSGVITVVEAGRYMVVSHISFAPPLGGTYRRQELLIDGTTEIRAIIRGPGLTGNYPHTHIGDTFELAAGTTVSVSVEQDSGSAINIHGPTTIASRGALVVQRVR